MTERNARVLLLGLDTDSEKGQALREILAEMDVEAVPISPAWKKEKVGDLAEGCFPDWPEEAEAAEKEFLLMSGLTDGQLDRFLKEMGKKNVRVAYKAVLTEHNRNWTLEALLKEIAQEHRYFAAVQSLQQAIRFAEAFPRQAKKPKAKQTLQEAKRLLQSQTDNIKAYEDVVRQLRLAWGQE